MGIKDGAKLIMSNAGVPVVPGYHGENRKASFLQQKANDIGYPLLIKAVSGGGGKGMRVVKANSDFLPALESAKREAQKYFADDRVLLEKYIDNPRHIEIQVFADNHGNVLHLFERDCSIQRRYQKIIEEAPAPGIDETTREAMGEAAIAAAKAIDYTGAGTVEFIMDGSDHYYFMEMNTRLQVEHPVTEKITGLDLVEWQLRVADNEVLPLTQEQIGKCGHALEVRIYAEDAENNFLPSVGLIESFNAPECNDHVRFDSGVCAGDTVSSHYDPMIAKLIVWDKNRAMALQGLSRSLQELHIKGVKTNIDYLQSIIDHPVFIAAGFDTHFIDNFHNDLKPSTDQPDPEILCLAAAYVLQLQKPVFSKTGDPWSPWNHCNHWRLNGVTRVAFELHTDEEILKFKICAKGNAFQLSWGDNKSHFMLLQQEQNRVAIQYQQRRFAASFFRQGERLEIHTPDSCHTLRLYEPLKHVDIEDSDPGSLHAPMPGKLIQLLVQEGAKVSKGDPLLILEAMKMEQTIIAPFDGVVETLHYAEGDSVDEGKELLHLAPD